MIVGPKTQSHLLLDCLSTLLDKYTVLEAQTSLYTHIDQQLG